MQYVDDEWKNKMANELSDAASKDWFTTRLAIYMAEGLLGSHQASGKNVDEIREWIYTTVLRERLNGEGEPK